MWLKQRNHPPRAFPLRAVAAPGSRHNLTFETHGSIVTTTQASPAMLLCMLRVAIWEDQTD